MGQRRNECDVTDQINTTEPSIVADEVCRIFQQLYQREADPNLRRAFIDIGRLYRGEFPGYYACDTDYHDIQHVLDVTLAMARLLDGCVRATNADTVKARLFQFGVITALFHDCGYIRHRKDTKHSNGAEYTRIHVSRGASFLEEYLPTIGMGDLAAAAARTIHFTGYEIPVDKIKVDPEFRLIGNLLGSADILAQMADRCYLEKCYDRLYPEFLRGGIARRRTPEGREEVLFASAADLIFKTPVFFQSATRRLQKDLGGGAYGYIETHFNGENVYHDEVTKNIDHARAVAQENDISLLRRQPPVTTDSPPEASQPKLI